MSTITIKATLTFEHVSGPETDADTLLDQFAGEVGQQNAAPYPLKLVVAYSDTDEFSVYTCKLVD